MSEKFPTTGSGKGDKSRISKFKKYQDNYDNIFSKSKETSKKVEKKNNDKRR